MYARQFWGYSVAIALARNCLASTLAYILMQMRKYNRENSYSFRGQTKVPLISRDLGNIPETYDSVIH